MVLLQSSCRTLAQLDDWEIPRNKKGSPACMVTYATPVNSSSDECDIESSDKEEPLTQIVKKYLKHREPSSDEDDNTLDGTCKENEGKGYS